MVNNKSKTPNTSPYNNHIYPETRDRDLWVAVILQAFRDATANPMAKRRNSPGEVHNTECARVWLLRNSADKMEVCLLADIGHAEVTAAAKRLEASGWPPMNARSQSAMMRKGRGVTADGI